VGKSCGPHGRGWFGIARPGPADLGRAGGAVRNALQGHVPLPRRGASEMLAVMRSHEHYVIPHSLAGEQARLRLMSGLLDPQSRRHLTSLGLAAGWSCLEFGAGNGTVSEWIAARVGPGGRVLCTDADTTFLDGLQASNLEVARLDVTVDPLPPGAFDLIFGRAVLHHIPTRDSVLVRLREALKVGGWLLCIEPDFSPALTVEPPSMASLWHGFVEWASAAGIDYSIGRWLPRRLAELDFEAVGAEATLQHFNGGSPGSEYWVRSLQEMGPDLVASDHVRQQDLDTDVALLGDPTHWTYVAAFTATWGRRMPSR
jgi:SAM-dependent methyltransferase